MQTIVNALAAFILVSALALSEVQSPPPPPPAPAKPVRIVGRAQVFYFKEANLSRVTVGFTLLGDPKISPPKDMFQVSAGYSMKGETLYRPRAINLNFFSYTRGTAYKYSNDHQAAIVIDDKVAISGTATPDFRAIDPRGSVTEAYNFAIPFELLDQIVNAKSSRLKFGKSVFEFNAEAISALKDLQKAIG